MTISKKRLNEIASIKDKNIDYSDIPELDESFWARATIQTPATKKQLTVRLDADVLMWLKSQGKGYQSRINAILRSYYEAHREDAPKHEK